MYLGRRCTMKRVYVLVMVITIGFSAGAQQHQSPDMVLVEGGASGGGATTARMMKSRYIR
jgi:hypothetical protein